MNKDKKFHLTMFYYNGINNIFCMIENKIYLILPDIFFKIINFENFYTWKFQGWNFMDFSYDVECIVY